MTDASIYIQRSLDANSLREPVLRSVIQSLQLPLESHGLDAGCGIGLQALPLAGAVGPGGHITGIDIVPELLAFGNDNVRRAGCSDRIKFCAGDASRLPFDKDTFDWAWSADCIGYPLGELAPFVEPAPGRFTHHLELNSEGDVDDQVRCWLQEAWQAAA